MKLKYLCKTAEVGSVRKAAEALNITPGAISKALKSLSYEFGIKIFVHTSNGSKLTDEGQKLYEYSKNLVANYESIRKKFEPVKTNEILKLGSYFTFTSFVLEEMLEQQMPNVSIFQNRFPPGDLEKAVLDRRIDIGITCEPFPQNGLDVIPVTTFKMGIFSRLNAFKNMEFEKIPFVTSVTEIQNSSYAIRNIDAWPYENLLRNIKYQVFGLDIELGIARRGLAAIYCPNFIVVLHNKIVAEKFHLFPCSAASFRDFNTHEFTISLLKRSGMPENLNFRRIALYFRALCRNRI